MPDYHQFLFVKGKTDKSSFSYLPDSSSKKKKQKQNTQTHTKTPNNTYNVKRTHLINT